MNRSTRNCLAAAAGFFFVTMTPALADAPAGFLWQTTSQMVMEGMPFSPPPTTLKICAAAQWTGPPPGGDRTCVSSDYQRVGNKATWTMQCSGDMPMTGTGEMNFEGTDAYTGQITAVADDMTILIKLSGKKLGTCNNPQ